MASHTESMMRDYFRDAPPTALTWGKSQPYWAKVHVGWEGVDSGGVWSHAAFYEEGKTQLTEAEEGYHHRPEAFECSALGS